MLLLKNITANGDINSVVRLTARALTVTEPDNTLIGDKTLPQYIQEKSPDLTPYSKSNQDVTFKNITANGDINSVVRLTARALTVTEPDNTLIGDKTLPQYIQLKAPTPDLTPYTTNASLATTLKSLYPSTFHVRGTKTFTGNSGNQETPELIMFSDERTNKDFVIQNVTNDIGGRDILMNPRWGGDVHIGYDKYGLDGQDKDTNIPNSRLAVKGDISALGNICSFDSYTYKEIVPNNPTEFHTITVPNGCTKKPLYLFDMIKIYYYGTNDNVDNAMYGDDWYPGSSIRSIDKPNKKYFSTAQTKEFLQLIFLDYQIMVIIKLQFLINL